MHAIYIQIVQPRHSQSHPPQSSTRPHHVLLRDIASTPCALRYGAPCGIPSQYLTKSDASGCWCFLLFVFVLVDCSLADFRETQPPMSGDVLTWWSPHASVLIGSYHSGHYFGQSHVVAWAAGTHCFRTACDLNATPGMLETSWVFLSKDTVLESTQRHAIYLDLLHYTLCF